MDAFLIQWHVMCKMAGTCEILHYGDSFQVNAYLKYPTHVFVQI